MKKRVSCILVLANLILIPLVVGNQPYSISGRITDPAGVPVSGGLVLLRGVQDDGKPQSDVKALVDHDGHFRINVPEHFQPSQLVITAPTFAEQTIRINTSQSSLDQDLGSIALHISCSDPGVICDDFGIKDR